MTSERALRIPAGSMDLCVRVVDDLAHLELRPRADVNDPGAPGPDGSPGPHVAVEVSARALVAVLRAAWADAHRAPTFEPWRAARYSGCGPDPYGPADDLGDGDPAGYVDPRDDTFRRPAPASGPARSGQPWTPDEEAQVRTMWLAAAPDADRYEVYRDIAEKIERGVGGVMARLRQLACDPLRPGEGLDRPGGMPLRPPSDHEGDAMPARPALTLVPRGT